MDHWNIDISCLNVYIDDKTQRHNDGAVCIAVLFTYANYVGSVDDVSVDSEKSRVFQ